MRARFYRLFRPTKLAGWLAGQQSDSVVKRPHSNWLLRESNKKKSLLWQLMKSQVRHTHSPPSLVPTLVCYLTCHLYPETNERTKDTVPSQSFFFFLNCPFPVLLLLHRHRFLAGWYLVDQSWLGLQAKRHVFDPTTENNDTAMW